jgi:hypothetical protein
VRRKKDVGSRKSAKGQGLRAKGQGLRAKGQGGKGKREEIRSYPLSVIRKRTAILIQDTLGSG